MSFPDYLISIGYVPHYIDFNDKLVPGKFKHRYSTLGIFEYHFIKGDSTIIWGLNEVGNPPMLIWPRPNDGEVTVQLNGKSARKLMTDDEMYRIILSTTNEELFGMIVKR